MKHLLLNLSMFIPGILLSQTSQEVIGDPYFESFRLHLNSLKKLNVVEDTLYVMKCDYAPDFSGSVDGVLIKMIDYQILFEMTKNKKGWLIIKIAPMRYEDGNPIIGIINFGVSRKGNHYYWTKDSFSAVQLTYDCEQKGFKYHIVYEN